MMMIWWWWWLMMMMMMNILEKTAQIALCWGRPPQSLRVVKTELTLLGGLATACSRSCNQNKRQLKQFSQITFFVAQFFSRTSKVFKWFVLSSSDKKISGKNWLYRQWVNKNPNIILSSKMEDQDKDKLSCTTLTALCVSLKSKFSGTCSTTLKWPRIRFQRSPLASLPACQPASRASATCRRSLPAGPVRAMAPTCGTNLRFKSPSSRWLRPQFKFQLFKFQV